MARIISVSCGLHWLYYRKLGSLLIVISRRGFYLYLMQ